MESTRFGVSRASRQMQTRTSRREQKLEAQADAEETQELNSFFDYEDDYTLAENPLGTGRVEWYDDYDDFDY